MNITALAEEIQEACQNGASQSDLIALLSPLAARLAEAEHWRDNHLAVLEKIKVALAMPGTGNYVDFARECRAAWGAANPTTEVPE